MCPTRVGKPLLKSRHSSYSAPDKYGNTYKQSTFFPSSRSRFFQADGTSKNPLPGE